MARQLAKNDQEAFVTALTGLGVAGFFISYRKDVKTRDGNHCSTYFRDEQDLVHVHTTMIVARAKFEGSDPTKSSKFPTYPYMAQLSSWISRDDTTRPICSICFLMIPHIGVCDTCEFDINGLGDE